MAVNGWKTILLGVAVISMVTPALAAEVRYFRFKNSAGSTVISPAIPPEYASQGYSIINSKGRVLEEIPPALTRQEILEKREQEIRTLAAEGQKAEQRSSDEALMKLYSTVPDIERAEERAISEIEDRIKITHSNIQRLNTMRENKERLAADKERAGKAVPERVLRDIAEIDQAVEEDRTEIARREQDKTFVRERFTRDTHRLKRLLGIIDDQGTIIVRKAVESLRPEQLGGIWRSRDKSGNRYEWIINPKGNFSWFSNQIDGGKLLILGSWGLEKGVLVITSELRQTTSPDGSTSNSATEEQRQATVVAIKDDEFSVLLENETELRFQRAN